MSQGRYSQRGWAFQSFAFRTWGLAGADATTDSGVPSGGVVASQLSRSVFATPDRCVDASQFSRVVVALPERIR
jgi:hypothetical protein